MEDFADQAAWDADALDRNGHAMPRRAADRRRSRGVWHEPHPGRRWKGFASRDGNLIAGQQNFSGSATAQLLIEAVRR